MKLNKDGSRTIDVYDKPIRIGIHIPAGTPEAIVKLIEFRTKEMQEREKKKYKKLETHIAKTLPL